MPLSDQDQVEAFGILSEECGEVVQECGKIFRHGLDSKNPLSGLTNKQKLENEIGNILSAVNLLVCMGLVDENKINQSCLDKLDQFKDENFPYVYFSPEILKGRMPLILLR